MHRIPAPVFRPIPLERSHIRDCTLGIELILVVPTPASSWAGKEALGVTWELGSDRGATRDVLWLTGMTVVALLPSPSQGDGR